MVDRVSPAMRRTVFGVLLVAVVAVLGWVGPIPQDPAYHLYADRRPMLGVPYGWLVLSNLAFVAVGMAGFGYVARLWRHGGDRILVFYATLYAGVLLTGLGSAYYHFAPDNDTLVWDRLAMAVSFAGFFCSVVAELVSRRLAFVLLPVWLLAGLGGVAYWIATEHAGVGDLRAYAVAQFLPVLWVPLLLVLYPHPRHYTPYMLALIALYVLAKAFELLDADVYNLTGWVSGHVLKHLTAAAAPAVLLPMLRVRHGQPETFGRRRDS